MSEHSPIVLWSVAVYRRLLAVYPGQFRRRYGRHMQDLFEDRLRAAARGAGVRGVIRVWLGAARDLIKNGASERWTALRRHRRTRNTPPARARARGGGLGGWMHNTIKDVRYALRIFVRAPAFTAIAVSTLALGIGANTAIFSVVRAVLLAPLPYAEPDRLVMIWSELTNRNVTRFSSSPPLLQGFRDTEAFESVSGVFTFGGSLTGLDGPAEQVQVGFVTDELFGTIGVAPMLGRGFEPADAVFVGPQDPGSAVPTGAVILDHGFWERRFGGDPGVIGRTVQLNGGPAEIVGVMPPGFTLWLPPATTVSPEVDLWTAARLDFSVAPEDQIFLSLLARLKDGTTLADAQGAVDLVAEDFRTRSPTFGTAGYAATVAPLHDELTIDVKPTVLALLGAVGFVLLIACANVANLLLVRATARTREISVRAALGGTRGRLVRQMLAESAVLALLGCALGLLLARFGVDALLLLRPADVPRITTTRMDVPVFGFAIAASVAASLLFGLFPALQASRANLSDALRGRAAIGTSGWPRHLRNAMVVGEVALSLVLLVGTGLMVRSFVALQRVDPGFDPEGVLTFSTPIPFNAYPRAEQRATFQTRLQQRLTALPGVETVGGAWPLPLSGQPFNGRYGTQSAAEDARNFLQAEYRTVQPGYFEAVGTRLLEGRAFTMADYADSLPLVIVDDVLAEKTWPGESAVGKRLLVRITQPVPEWVDVIGVVEHQRHASLAEEGRETVYFTDRYAGSFGALGWTIKASGDPLLLTTAVRNAVTELDPAIPLADVRLMSSLVDGAQASTRFALVLIAVFGVSALGLASVGLYGVLSFVVRQRTSEIGVRMAFGAEPSRVLRLVVGQGLTLAGLGLGIGLLAALGVTRAIRSLLVGVTPTDPFTFVGIAVVFMAVALLASVVPALRATRVDPVVALREE